MDLFNKVKGISSWILKYERYQAGTWTRHVIDARNGVREYPMMVFDPADSSKVHIGYYDQTNGSLRYATNNR